MQRAYRLLFPLLFTNKHDAVLLTLSAVLPSPSNLSLRNSQTRNELQQLTEDVVEEIAVVVIGLKSLLQCGPPLKREVSTVCFISSRAGGSSWATA